jgi:hypothetical protein
MLTFFAFFACFSAECTDESGRTFASGESWECDDGCNTCACEAGAISSTLMYCAEGTCTDESGTYNVGDSWTCPAPNDCNTCSCEDQDTIVATEMGCLGDGCTDESGSYADGESWTCPAPNDCNTCSCDDGSIVSTDLACGDDE